MAPTDEDLGADLRLMHEASKRLLGYFAHTWFNHYLSVIDQSLGRLHQMGVIAGLYDQNPDADNTILFDFGALNLEKLAYINGIYFYLLAAHKGANYQLMHRFDGPQVLYLRGYEFEGSISTGGDLAMGTSSMDTMQFNHTLADVLGKSCKRFKVMSPKDLYWETVDAQRYFYGNFEPMVRLASSDHYSLCLNALDWEEQVKALLPRMNHYVVYVSSITEGLLWELSQLDTDARRERVTVVFDDRAIENKTLQLALRDHMQEAYGDRVLWAKQGGAPIQTAEELRMGLEAVFHVTTPEAFVENAQTHIGRIEGSMAEQPAGTREGMVPFGFGPALEHSDLSHLQALTEQLAHTIDDQISNQSITCLPHLFGLLQMQIYLTLLLARHADTGANLVTYAGIMSALRAHYVRPGDILGALSAENRDDHLQMLQDHHDVANDIAYCFLATGPEDNFGNNVAKGQATHARLFEAAEAATTAAIRACEITAGFRTP